MGTRNAIQGIAIGVGVEAHMAPVPGGNLFFHERIARSYYGDTETWASDAISGRSTRAASTVALVQRDGVIVRRGVVSDRPRPHVY